MSENSQPEPDQTPLSREALERLLRHAEFTLTARASDGQTYTHHVGAGPVRPDEEREA